MVEPRRYTAIVIGASAGGMAALNQIFCRLPAGFPAPILVVNHIHPHSDSTSLADYFSRQCLLRCKVADEKEVVEPATVYLAPANYHLLVEVDRRLALSIDAKVNFSRPSIDVLFESAAEVYQEGLIGIVLTGGSKDGAVGLKRISDCGGYTIVQDPETAETPLMPQSALLACPESRVMMPATIGKVLRDAVRGGALLI